MKKYIKCYDKFNQQLSEGDYVDVQKDGVHQIYKKEDGQLYFKPYGKEDMVCAYFSNDIAKCDIDGNWLNNDRYEDIEEEDDYSKILKATMVPKEYFGEDAAREYYRRGIGTPSLNVTSVLQEESFSIRQETLEEAAEKEFPLVDTKLCRTGACEEENLHLLGHRKSFIKGAKYQTERMYSEEDLVHLLNFVSKEYNISNGIGWFHTHESIEDVSSKDVLDKWFEQFKKK